MNRVCFINTIAMILTTCLQICQADSSEIKKEPIEIYIVSDFSVKDGSPSTYSDIDLKDLDVFSTVREPSFLLGRNTSISSFSDSGSHQGYSYIRLRGIDQTRLNATLDGVPLNEPEDQGLYFSNYSGLLGALDRVQIQRGLGASQNGSSSFGGSLLFESLDLSSRSSKEVTIGGGSYGTNNAYTGINTGVHNSVGAHLRAAILHTDGYKSRSSNDSKSVFYKVGLFDEKNEKSDWTLSGFAGQQSNQFAWLGSTKDEIEKDPKTNSNGGENDNFFQTLTHLQNLYAIDSDQEIRTSFYYNFLEGNYDFNLNNYLSLPPSDELFNYRLSSHLGGFFSTYRLELDSVSLISGVHANNYIRRHIGSEQQIGELYRNHGRKDDYATFSRIEYYKGDFIFLADTQLRHTTFQYYGTADIKQKNWTFINPKAGITYLVGKSSQLYYSVGRTGREPTRNDLLLGNDNALVSETGDPILGSDSPEYVVDQELGIRSSFKSFNYATNLFYMDFKNEILLNGQFGPNGLPLTQGVKDSYRKGVEVEFSWQAKENLKTSFNLAYIQAKVSTGQTSFSPIMTPEFIANHRVEYTLLNCTAAADIKHQSSSFIDFANSESIDAFVVVDLSLQVEYKDYVIGFFINNLFDDQYFTNGYVDPMGTPRYFVQAPLNFYTSITWKL